MYKCEDCGWEFEYDDILWLYESHGEKLGHCPHCCGLDYDYYE